MTALLKPTRAEAGSTYYACHEVREVPGEFVFYEIWASRAALDAHMQTPHLQALLSKVDALFAEAPDIKFLQKLS